MKVRKLEDEIEQRKQDMVAKDKELRLEEAKTMEYLFEKTQWEQKFSRMEARIIELEASIKNYSSGSANATEANGKMVDKDAEKSKKDAVFASRRERNLE